MYFDSSSSRSVAHLFEILILFHELAKSTNLSQKSGFVESSKYPFSLANLRCVEEEKLVGVGFNFPSRVF